MAENTKIYFHIQQDEWSITAESADSGNALVVIKRGGKTVKEFLWPAYKVWNLSAHANEIFTDIEQGLRRAGSTGFGGNVYGG